MQLLKAAVVGGGICLLGQLLFDAANLTTAHTMSILVSAGAILGGLGWYDKLADWAGFGARLPISSFGNTLVQGAMEGAGKNGFWGILTGMLEPVSAGVAAAVAFGFIIALVFRPKA
ncbi:MAG: SpoVA/SpoVAEb family sporulation membrane protein [Firmicutes bacterium]|nr:SpoVA/SpoVAEb family sporulation membrane protein [Bacillota bacterium]